MDKRLKLVQDMMDMKKKNDAMIIRLKNCIDTVDESIALFKDFIPKLDRLKSFGETGNHKKARGKLS